MVPTGNKAKSLSSVNHTTITIHHSLSLSLILWSPLDWSFISIQNFVPNLDDWFDALSNKFIIFGIPLLYYYIIILILIHQ